MNIEFILLINTNAFLCSTDKADNFSQKCYAKGKVLFMYNLYPFRMSLMIGNLSH